MINTWFATKKKEIKFYKPDPAFSCQCGQTGGAGRNRMCPLDSQSRGQSSPSEEDYWASLRLHLVYILMIPAIRDGRGGRGWKHKETEKKKAEQYISWLTDWQKIFHKEKGWPTMRPTERGQKVIYKYTKLPRTERSAEQTLSTQHTDICNIVLLLQYLFFH